MDHIRIIQTFGGTKKIEENTYWLDFHIRILPPCGGEIRKLLKYPRTQK